MSRRSRERDARPRAVTCGREKFGSPFAKDGVTFAKEIEGKDRARKSAPASPRSHRRTPKWPGMKRRRRRSSRRRYSGGSRRHRRLEPMDVKGGRKGGRGRIEKLKKHPSPWPATHGAVGNDSANNDEHRQIMPGVEKVGKDGAHVEEAKSMGPARGGEGMQFDRVISVLLTDPRAWKSSSRTATSSLQEDLERRSDPRARAIASSQDLCHARTSRGRARDLVVTSSAERGTSPGVSGLPG